jgi:hypothetical protein
MVMVFDKETDVYNGFDREVTVAEFAASVESGEAAAHDLYWAFFVQDDGAASLESTDAAAAFAELEAVLGLGCPARTTKPNCTTTTITTTTNRDGDDDGGSGDHGSPLTMWAGPAGHVEYLHYDDEDNLHLVVCGRKHWLLFPPADAFWNRRLNYVGLLPAVYARVRGHPPPYAGNPNRKMLGDPAMAVGSAVGVDAVVGGCSADRKRFRRYCSSGGGAGASPRETVLEAGDALYLPAGWSHEVSSEAAAAAAAAPGGATEAVGGGDAFVLSVRPPLIPP